MSPYIGTVIFLVVLLFIPISLAPLVFIPPDVKGRMESDSIQAGRDDQSERMESAKPGAEEVSTLE